MNQSSLQVRRSVQAFYRDMQYLRRLSGGEVVDRPVANKSNGIVCMMVDSATAVTLSPRQYDVMQQMRTMNSRKKIAERMGISIKTLEDHLSVMRKKLGCDSIQAIFDMVQAGLLTELKAA